MQTNTISLILLILGPLLTGIGFGGMPARVYTEKDIEKRSALMAAMTRRWVICQAFVILGCAITVVGMFFLAGSFRAYPATLLSLIGAVSLAIGHVFWIWHVFLRAVYPQKFTKFELPGWLLQAYSLLTLAALAFFGAAFWVQRDFQALGGGILAATAIIFGMYLKMNDMPPFVYYTMILVTGLVLL